MKQASTIVKQQVNSSIHYVIILHSSILNVHKTTYHSISSWNLRRGNSKKHATSGKVCHPFGSSNTSSDSSHQ